MVNLSTVMDTHVPILCAQNVVVFSSHWPMLFMWPDEVQGLLYRVTLGHADSSTYQFSKKILQRDNQMNRHVRALHSITQVVLAISIDLRSSSTPCDEYTFFIVNKFKN